jgi:hypothetical protein
MPEMSTVFMRAREFYYLNKKEVLLGTIIFLVAFLSFNLGFFFAEKNLHAPIIIEKCSESQK